MILIDDLINDSISYFACVTVRISDDFYDDFSTIPDKIKSHACGDQLGKNFENFHLF